MAKSKRKGSPGGIKGRHIVGKEREAEVLDLLAERERQILELRKAGKSQTAIGREIGISQQAVSKIVRIALGRMGKENDERAVVLRELIFQRLERMYEKVHKRIGEGDLAAINTAVKVLAQISRLHGLNKEVVKDDGTTPDGITVRVEAVLVQPGGEEEMLDLGKLESTPKQITEGKSDE